MAKRAYDKYVLEVNRRGSLTRAAASLSISQPAISAGLSTLEKQLGFRIFNRDTSPVSLTDEGKLYVDYLEQKELLEKTYGSRMAELNRERGQTVTVGAPTVYVEKFLVPAAAVFSARYPEVCVRLVTGSVEELFRKLRRGDLQIAVSTTGDIPGELNGEAFGEEKVCLVVPEKYAASLPMDGSEGEIAEAVRDIPFILLAENQPLEVLFRAWCDRHGLVPRAAVRVDQVMTAVRLAAGGIGAAAATTSSLPAGSAEGLRVILLPGAAAAREIYAVTDRDQYLPSAVEHFLEVLKEIGGREL